MLTKDEILDLRMGDKIEAGTLFGGMSQEQLTFEVTGTQKVTGEQQKVVVALTATYFGVFVGKWVAQVDGGKISWFREIESGKEAVA